MRAYVVKEDLKNGILLRLKKYLLINSTMFVVVLFYSPNKFYEERLKRLESEHVDVWLYLSLFYKIAIFTKSCRLCHTYLKEFLFM